VSAGAAEKARAGSGAVVRKASRFSATAQEEDVRLEQLERLARLRAAGVIDDEDLRAAKARVLGDDNGGDARADDVTAVPPSR